MRTRTGHLARRAPRGREGVFGGSPRVPRIPPPLRAAGRAAACAALLGLRAGPAGAQGGAGRLAGPPLRAPQTLVETRAERTAPSGAADGAARLDITSLGGSLRHAAPAANGGEWSAGVRAERVAIATGARLPGSGAAVPGALWDVRAEAGYRRFHAPGRAAGIALRAASPSDRPFGSWAETGLGATAHVRVPGGKHRSWIFLLDYASRRSFLAGVPLPGIAWVYAPSRDRLVVLGVPFSLVRLRLAGTATLEASYLPPRQGAVRLGLDLPRALEPFVAFRAQRDAFLRAGREAEDDRLQYRALLGEAGLRWTPRPAWSVEAAARYAFERSLGESDRLDGGRERVDIEDGFGFGARVACRL